MTPPDNQHDGRSAGRAPALAALPELLHSKAHAEMQGNANGDAQAEADDAVQGQALDEAMWVDVIQKMDEVYSKLVSDEIVLEQKNEELENSQQFIDSVLSSMSDVLIACDRGGAIEQTNAALRELVGLDAAALLGMPIFELLADAASSERLRAVIATATPQHASEVVELDLIHPGHSGVPVDVNCTRRLDGAGRLVGYVFVGRPMGELRRAYRDLNATHETLKRTQQQLLHAEKMASLGRLVAGVAHELNNPISFVLGNVHALKRYSERLASYVEALHGAAADQKPEQLRTVLRIDHILTDLPSLIDGTLEGALRTTEIVNGLKRFSAVDREERIAVDLNDVIARAIHWVSKGATPAFTVDWKPGPPLRVMGNAGKLLQVLMNLIENACDATAAVSCPQLWITANTEVERVVLALRDNGSGISVDRLSDIFDPFFTTKPVGKGTGLGLSISYGIIEQHGGTLHAHNHVPTGGAEFVITLPLARPAAISDPHG